MAKIGSWKWEGKVRKIRAQVEADTVEITEALEDIKS